MPSSLLIIWRWQQRIIHVFLFILHSNNLMDLFFLLSSSSLVNIHKLRVFRSKRMILSFVFQIIFTEIVQVFIELAVAFVSWQSLILIFLIISFLILTFNNAITRWFWAHRGWTLFESIAAVKLSSISDFIIVSTVLNDLISSLKQLIYLWRL